jgi:hypothetical protein
MSEKHKFYLADDARTTWQNVRSSCMTTFHLPERIYDNTILDIDYRCFDSLPFERFCVVEPFVHSLENLRHPERGISPESLVDIKEDLRGLEELVCWNQDVDTFGFISKARYFNGPPRITNYIKYSPEKSDENSDDRMWYIGQVQLYTRFWKLLNNRAVRFLESPLSRQYRRSLGAPPEYREYIIITKEDIRFPQAITRSAMMKRMILLHSVRGHLRRNWRTGEKSITVKPHVRGVGELTQVKDYHFK